MYVIYYHRIFPVIIPSAFIAFWALSSETKRINLCCFSAFVFKNLNF